MRDIGATNVLALALAAALLAGCPAETVRPARPNVELDPCAERLHDLCGKLLLYYSAHHKLPPTVEALTGGGARPACPVSNKPYVYRPAGLAVPGRPGRVVLFDPEPSHADMRYGVLVGTPAGTGLITANVILVSEQDMAAALAH